MDALPKRDWKRIADALRAELRSGALPPGSRLPSGRDLARRFGVSEWPVQRALASLVAEDLLERRPGHGTVVRAMPQGPVLVAFDTFGAYGGPYRWRLAEEICSALCSDGLNAFILPRDYSSAEGQKALRDVIAASSAAVVVAVCRKTTRAMPFWHALPVPVFCPGGTFADRMVLPRFVLYTKLAALLKRLGARRPALVSNLAPAFLDEFNAARQEGRDLLHVRYEAQLAHMFDFTMRNARIRFERERIAGVYGDMDRTSACGLQKRAYEATKRLLAATPRPDVLCAFPDDLIPGVVAAIGESGLCVPRDLRVVLHRNVGMEPFVPFPCEWIEQDPRQHARAVADVVRSILSGRPVEPEYKDAVLYPEG